MKLGPGNWRLVLTGNTARFLSAGGRDTRILEHVLRRLVAGDEAAASELAYWGIEARALDEATEDDVAAAIAGSYVEQELAGVELAALLEFHNRMIGERAGELED